MDAMPVSQELTFTRAEVRLNHLMNFNAVSGPLA
jgi:hypothetical protein